MTNDKGKCVKYKRDETLSIFNLEEEKKSFWIICSSAKSLKHSMPDVTITFRCFYDVYD